MARQVHAAGLRERRQMSRSDPSDEYKLEVHRPHPSTDGEIVEIWGRGSEEELQEKKERMKEEYGDEYTFTIVP